MKMAVSSMVDESLIDEREAQMVSVFGGKPFCRIAHFLKPPSSSSPKQAQTQYDLHLNYHPSKPISPILKSLTSKVFFHGWKHPLPNWNSWIENLRPSYESIWKKSHIYEAIMASKHEIPRCKHSIFALAEKWCSETKNTFVLPWGEVTITLEDAMVLGGFSVTGDSVLSEIRQKKLLEIEENLLMARSELYRSKSKKASQQQWMEMWMGKGRELEHEAFLCLWLSRYVLPAGDCSTMNKSVFQIAVLLARGTRIALAPAVLASIYKDLRLLKEKIVTIRKSSDQNDVSKLCLWAPFQLLQVWFWERFPKLSPNPNYMRGSVSRLIRWHKVKILAKGDVGIAMDSASDGFRWRPYSKPLNNWSFDIDLQSYGRCIRVSQLVGLDCIEPYFPHRVAMQFGLDQDIPIACPRLNDKTKNAWSDYNRQIEDIKLYIPPKLSESHVTTRYLEWWKKSKVLKESSSFEIKEGGPKVPTNIGERLRIKIENNEAEVPPGFSPNGKRMPEEADGSSHEHQPSAKQLKRSTDYPVVIDSSDSDASPGSSSRIKEVETKDNSDDDHRTLSQLFVVKGANRANQSGYLSISCQESPSSSAGDNTFIQEIKSVANNGRHVFSNEECITKNLNTEVGTESKAASPIRSSTSIEKKNVETSFNGAHDSSDIDLLDRIARLQRIVDMVKAAKTCQA